MYEWLIRKESPFGSNPMCSFVDVIRIHLNVSYGLVIHLKVSRYTHPAATLTTALLAIFSYRIRILSKKFYQPTVALKIW